jgi:hypothetical protein
LHNTRYGDYEETDLSDGVLLRIGAGELCVGGLWWVWQVDGMELLFHNGIFITSGADPTLGPSQRMGFSLKMPAS